MMNVVVLLGSVFPCCNIVENSVALWRIVSAGGKESGPVMNAVCLCGGVVILWMEMDACGGRCSTKEDAVVPWRMHPCGGCCGSVRVGVVSWRTS